MDKTKLFIDDSMSLNRPAWTSTPETGLFDSYKHKHCLLKGKFVCIKNFYTKD